MAAQELCFHSNIYISCLDHAELLLLSLLSFSLFSLSFTYLILTVLSSLLKFIFTLRHIAIFSNMICWGPVTMLCYAVLCCALFCSVLLPPATEDWITHKKHYITSCHILYFVSAIYTDFGPLTIHEKKTKKESQAEVNLPAFPIHTYILYHRHRCHPSY